MKQIYCIECNKPLLKKHITDAHPIACACPRARRGRPASGLLRRYVLITPDVEALLTTAAKNADAKDQVFAGALLTVAIKEHAAKEGK